ncbi:carbonic anhydrase family protein [Flavihumibacter solisilvae]|uniref:Carbonic anhydrase n=1 Tax=Flavihumibacter solisilvae TaxID=1349421 RepID=A0A0C1LC29_9BACT|nr:carbonic anhydrase family protein [Flavihumibacter solisilvae]KIC93053.1 carbonic anhydrase [Flavihumibacter solisilvae]
MTKFSLALICLFATGTFLSCQNNASRQQPENTSKPVDSALKPLREKVLTAEEQKALTPDRVIEILKEGNQRFRSNNTTLRDHSAMVRDAAAGQYPKAIVLSCVDSRIPVEDVFDRGIGDLFVARVAGNFVNTDILGSMEFACKVSGAKLVLVMGHEACGAIKAAIDNVKLGNITAMINNITPAVAQSQDFQGEKSSKNEAFVEWVAKKNVLNTITTLITKSAILKEMADNGEIKVIGAYYDLHTGEVIFL